MSTNVPHRNLSSPYLWTIHYHAIPPKPAAVTTDSIAAAAAPQSPPRHLVPTDLPKPACSRPTPLYETVATSYRVGSAPRVEDGASIDKGAGQDYGRLRGASGGWFEEIRTLLAGDQPQRSYLRPISRGSGRRDGPLQGTAIVLGAFFERTGSSRNASRTF